MADTLSENKKRKSENLATRIRIDVLNMVNKARSSHIAAAFSMADILAVLYSDILNFDVKNPALATRDRVILSKGHAGAGIYAVLAESGFFPKEDLATYCADGSKLSGHVSHCGVAGIELSTGSLGHGLPVAAGMAFALRMNKNPARVFVILGDGECNEGTTWESALFAAHNKLENLTVIVDRNKMQGLGNSEDIMSLEPFEDKWQSFNWETFRIDGHNHNALRDVFMLPPCRKPRCIIADTIKGRGVSFMENRLEWHYKPPVDDLYNQALRELEEQL